jgi:class 3 adenylate cyclase
VKRDLPSGTVTFLFTDIEGSTKLLHDLGPKRYARTLEKHRLILRRAFSAHGGVEVDTQGDAFFVAFPTAPGRRLVRTPQSRKAYDRTSVVSVGNAVGERMRWKPRLQHAVFRDSVGALVLLLPGAPLVPILFITQAINAVLLLPLLAFIAMLTRDRSLMGKYATGRAWTVVIVAVT